MTTKFDNYKTALNALLYNKAPDCRAHLHAEFDKAVEDGLPLREAYEKANLMHMLRDHNIYETYMGHEHKIRTDEEAYAAIEEAAQETIKEGTNEQEVQKFSELMRYWYDLIRSWGIEYPQIAFDYSFDVALEQLQEIYDMDEAEAIQLIERCPNERVKEAFYMSFYRARMRGETVLASLRFAYEENEHIVAEEMLSSLISDISNLMAGRGRGKEYIQ